MRPKRPIAQLLLLAIACLACTGGTFSCSSNHDDDDKIIVTGGRK